MRKYATHADPNEVRVLAVILDPLVKQRLAGTLDMAAVDMAVFPAVAKPPETFPKSATVSGRVAEGQPDDLRPFIGQGPFGDFPDLVTNRNFTPLTA
jgi:hypothetical protein